MAQPQSGERTETDSLQRNATDTDGLAERVAAIERAVADGDHDFSSLAAEGEQVARLDALAADVEELTDRVAELEAATQALRGYVGNVRSVNEDVQDRADLALSKVEDLQQDLADQTAQPAPAKTAETGTECERTRSKTASDGSLSSSETGLAVTDEEAIQTEPRTLLDGHDGGTDGQSDSGEFCDTCPNSDAGLLARMRALL